MTFQQRSVSILSFCLAVSLATLHPGLSSAADFETGLKYYESGYFPEAAQYFRRALLTRGQDPKVRYYLANTLLQAGQIVQAQSEFQKTLAMAPNTEAGKLSRQALGMIAQYQAGRYIQPKARLFHPLPGSGGNGSGKLSGLSSGKDNYLDDISENGRYIRWSARSMPLRYYIEHSPKGIKYFEPAYIAKAEAAIKVWEEALGRQLKTVIVSRPDQADIRLTWVNTLDSKGQEHGNMISYTAGLTQPSIGDGKLEQMVVKIATYDIFNKPQSAESIYSTTIHELGHALGLMGHSETPGDIMNAKSSGTQFKLSQRDINTIRALYTMDVDITSEEKEQTATAATESPTNTKREKELALKLDESIAKQEKKANNNGNNLDWMNLGVAYMQKAARIKEHPEYFPNNQLKPKDLYMKAKQALDKALTLEPRDARAYSSRAMVRLEIGEQRESLEDINLAIKYEPTDSQYYLEKAWILASLGRKPEAQSTLNAYLYREPHEANSSDVQKVRQKLAQ